VEPRSVPAQLNLGLLLAEMGRKEEAQTAFRRVLEVDPGSAAAAHNLGILLAKKNLEEAITWCRKAFDLLPGGKYGFTLAFYLQQKGDIDGAIRVLRKTIDKEPGYADAYHLLAELYSRQGRPGDASAVMQALQRLSKRQP
jgi:superkiller protein 3